MGGSPTERIAAAIVRARWVILGGWLAAAVVAIVTMPPPLPADGAGLRGLVPEDSAAIEAEIRDLEAFGFPVLSRTIVVQRDPDGLSPFAQSRVLLRAVNLTRGLYPRLDRIAGALPVTNTFGLVDPERAKGDTAITLLFFRPEVGVADRERLAKQFVREQLDPELDAPIGVTGSVPGRLEQGRLLKSKLPVIEVLTVVLILLIVGLHFRSVGAPFVALAAAGISYLISLNVITRVLASTGLGLPEELEPLIVVLLLGIVTDYSIFFLDHARDGLRRPGVSSMDVAGRSIVEIAPIVATAGVAIALGTAALVVARLDTFRALGPGMAVTVLVGMLVSATFVPVVIAVANRGLYWPSLGAASHGTDRHRSGWIIRLTEPRTARIVTVVGVAGLALLALATLLTSLGFSIVSALPRDNPARRAASAAARGFADGMISPTTLLVESRDGSPMRLRNLIELQRGVEAQPGIAGVIGPADVRELSELASRLPPDAVPGAGAEPSELILGTVVTGDRAAARMVVVLDEPPLAGPAVHRFRALRAEMPELLRDARIDPRSVQLGFAGDTAVAAETIDQTVDDLVRILATVGVLMILLLAVYLRALVAPVLLVAVSLLAFGSALGLTTLISGVVGSASMSFFVPFASAVLLVSLGSDYNIFLVGRIWKVAERRPFLEAIREAAPAASRSIGVAGITLAASFAILAIVPLRPMQQFALAMASGILLDTFVVRAVIVPAMLAAVGPRSGWPGGRLRGGTDVSGNRKPGIAEEAKVS